MWPFKAKAKPVEAAPVNQAPAVKEFSYDLLNRQMKKVYDVVQNGEWITLSQLAESAGAPESSVSARLRDLRKPQYGQLTVERRRDKEQGLYEYRLVQQ